MIESIKEFSGTLVEEIKYYDNAVTYKKSLEATLWGLEQQAQYDENSSKHDQEDLVEEINRCRVKIASLSKLLTDHVQKMTLSIGNFANGSQCGGCPQG